MSVVVDTTGCERPRMAPRGDQGPPPRGAAMHCPFCRHSDSRVVDSRTTDDGTAIRRRRQCPECGRRFTTVGDREPERPEALRRHRAVQPGQGARRASARPARADRSARTTWPCWPSGSRRPSGPPARPRSTPTRSAWPSSSRCASSTRWPTCASPASTRPSTPSRTSSPPSRCCGPSTRRPASSRASGAVGGAALDAAGGGRWGRHPPPVATSTSFPEQQPHRSARRQTTAARDR